MDLIERLYYGNINPLEQGLKEGSPAYLLRQELLSMQKSFCETLTDQQKTEFELLTDKRNELWCEYEKAKFVYGFQLGVQLLSQALGDLKNEI